MSASPEPQVVHDFYSAIERDSTEAIEALLDPDVIWHIPGRNPLSRTYYGKQETKEIFRGPFGATFEVEDVLTGEQYVMALVRVSELDGKPFEGRYIHVLRTKDGRIAESWHFDEDQSRLDDLLRGDADS